MPHSALDRETDTALVLLAAPSHPGKLLSVASRAVRRDIELLDSSDSEYPHHRTQHYYSNNSRTHRRLRVMCCPRAVSMHARRISAVRWILRLGVCALSEVSMSNGRCAGLRRNIGLTTTRKTFCCCSDRCLALASSASLLGQRYNYILVFSSACWRIYYFFFLHSFSWVDLAAFVQISPGPLSHILSRLKRPRSDLPPDASTHSRPGMLTLE